MFDGVFSLPKNSENDKSYKNVLSNAVDDVIKEYDKLSNEKNSKKIELIKNGINEVYNDIINSYDNVFKGDYVGSVEIMRKLINKYDSFLKVSIKKSFAFNHRLPNFNYGLEELFLFKGRISKDPYYEYPIEQMHQIPLDKRELTMTQRYSMPGVPCLYLAHNSYVAWHEMNNPTLNVFSISAFEIEDLDKKILDLTYSYRQIFEYVKERYINDSRENLKVKIEGVEIEIPGKEAFPYDSQYGLDVNDDNSFILLASIWPLLASVSIHCSQKDRTFKSD